MSKDEVNYVLTTGGRIAYRSVGNGKKLILAFHGFGSSAIADFGCMLELLQNDYTVLLIDLPHHGQTKWNKEVQFEEEHLVQIVNELVQEGCSFSLLGYSMGARICMSVAIAMPVRVRQMILVAPDGFYKDRYYSFLMQTAIGSCFFRLGLEHEGLSRFVLKLLGRLGLLPAITQRMVLAVLNNEDRRQQVLNGWPCFSKMQPDLSKLRSIMSEHTLTMHLILGVKDEVIKNNGAVSFANGLRNVQLHRLERGHRVIDAQNAAAVMAAIGL